jgi:hypothetical protein
MTPAFKTFMEQMEAALGTEEVALQVDMHPNVKLVLQDQQRLITQQGEIMRRVPGNFESMQHEIQGLRITAAERLDQAMFYLDAMFDYSIRFAREHSLRLESKLDYLISRLGPPSTWQPFMAPSCQCQYALGCDPALATPTTGQYHQHRSTTVTSDPHTRRLAPVPVTASASEPPRWTPVAQPQPKLLGAMPVHPQQSMTMTTTATTTTTTATMATTTTSLTIDGLTVNYRLGNVPAIWDEYKNFERKRQKVGLKALGLSRAHEKQLNNKRRVIEEIEYLAQQIREKDSRIGQEDARQLAMSELDKKFIEHSWTVNQLINYCRDQKATRNLETK